MGTYTNDIPVAKTPELTVSRERLDKALADLEDNLQTLRARLEPVMRPDSPSPVAEGSQTKPVEIHSQTVSHIDALFVRVGYLNDIVSNIKSRLEV